MAQQSQEDEMIVIAHRGASGERPEHTLAAYDLAIAQGADYIEPDLVPTADGVLVARHENAIGGTTDVADRPEFAERRTTKVVDGEEVTGWFTEDFTLAELRTLRARERLPEIRPANTAYDGLYEVPTLAEVIQLVQASEEQSGRPIGLYPELKHPTYFEELGFDVAATLVEQLHEAGYRGEDAPVFIQSFEIGVLVRLNEMTDLPLVQLVNVAGGPFDRQDLTWPEMLGIDGMTEIARYADGIGAPITLVLSEQGTSTGFVERAQSAGLLVHAWTLRRENAFLPPSLQRGEAPSDHGCAEQLLLMLQAVGVNGVFADQPGMAVEWRDRAAMPPCATRRPADAER
ncbi:glycerophosphodiester phosphodiesterase [Aurantiacibacter aquimixticola]|uniref:glycerophosphodiester phosphodiesterase n=1 Tax=Aurantiacibacter aquimixticola TaxID=1958945 RepID=A0A419RU75_9SPHN|nr:glycerophosphodiester phosphodiesterase [Aurantiacibacter aquimixticola]RJY09332.1 glycerophosphodiester phosphodiesterase [Aurantiacibacter aquimixticola]